MLAFVGLITLASLRMNSENVELLRFLGAPDRYLARQFERHALLSSLQGGLIGFALALLTVIGLLYSSRRMDLAEAIELGLRPLDWLLLACMPVDHRFAGHGGRPHHRALGSGPDPLSYRGRPEPLELLM